MEHRLSAPLSTRMLDWIQVQEGDRVLDMATGRGEPAIPAAHRVGENGSVIAIDRSESMLEMARERARSEGLLNIDFRVGDAEHLSGIESDSVDHVLARWCLMYFDSPESALRQAYRVLKPNGQLIAAVWAEPERVSYFTFPRQVLAQLCDISPIEPHAPGTFAYASIDRIHRDMATAGFEILQLEEMQVDVMQAHDAHSLIEWTRCFGMNRLLKELPDSVQLDWERLMLEQSDRFKKDNQYRLGGVTRIVLARKSQ
jgi:ubiquinone/menaquinone biosynthesis C-methylase UbiE